MQKALALLLSAAMLLCLHPAAAQQPNTLTGTVTDSASGKAVGYATVSLQRDSVTVVNAVAADSDGRFSLKAPETGDYQLCITMVGYTPYKQAVEVPASGKALGKIAITQGVEVGDVVIEVQKPLVMADAEKTTYSVEDRRLRRAHSTKSSARFRNSRSTATATSCSTDRAITRYCSTGAIRQR